MSISPLVTFKAGYCDLDNSTDPPTVKPRPTAGYIYLYSEDDLIHFCWRPRSASLEDPELDLIMVPLDGTFKPHHPSHSGKPQNPQKPTNGRIYVLQFTSSFEKHLFWLQSKSQSPTQDPSWFSARDLKLGEIVNNLLQGEEVDVQQSMADLPEPGNDGGDDDETMEDVEGTNHPEDQHRSGSGGAGPGATGGDIREEGEGSREGGADGGRATTMDAQTIIQNFINSMSGSQEQPQPSGQTSGQQEKIFTTLPDLLTPQSTLPFLEQSSEATVDRLLQHLPTTLVSMAQEADDDTEVNTETSIRSAREALTLAQKKGILKKVLHSPQFSQSLASLTFAIRDGGLPIISESLKFPVRNGGYMRRGGVPLGGGDAVEAFLQGVKDAVQEDVTPDVMDTE